MPADFLLLPSYWVFCIFPSCCVPSVLPQPASPPHLPCICFVSPALFPVFFPAQQVFTSLCSFVFLHLSSPAPHRLVSLVMTSSQCAAFQSTWGKKKKKTSLASLAWTHNITATCTHWPSFIKQTYGRKTRVRPFPRKLRHLSIWTWAEATIRSHVRPELVCANLSLWILRCSTAKSCWVWK